MNWLGNSIAKVITNEVTKSSRERYVEQVWREREERERANPALREERLKREKKENRNSTIFVIIEIIVFLWFMIWFFSNVS